MVNRRDRESIRTAISDGRRDPRHGGNEGLIGWQLIGYPGPQMSFWDEIDKNYGQPWRGKPMSLEQVVGHPVKGWEEDRE